MLLAIDIGNTNGTWGIFKDRRLLHTFNTETQTLQSARKSAGCIGAKLSVLKIDRNAIEAVFACSVVPALNHNLRKVVKAVFGKQAVVAGEDATVPIMNRYRIPEQVGQDRLVNAYAGLKEYGGGLIIVDFGTAITFDIVSKRSEYLGGLIVPGLRLMQEALHKKTALLPYVELARPIEIIGRDTAASIRAGIVYGVAGLCDGVIEKLLKKDCRGYKVIATGGDACLIKPFSHQIARIDEFLILKGLSFLFESQKILK